MEEVNNHEKKAKELRIRELIDDLQSISTQNPTGTKNMKSTLTWTEIGEVLYNFGWRKKPYTDGKEVHWKDNPLKCGDKVITMGEVMAVEPTEYGVLVKFPSDVQVWLIYESLLKVQ